MQSEHSENDQRNEVKSLRLDKSCSAVSDNLTAATDFSNGKDKDSTENSNHDAILILDSNPTKISTNVTDTQKNLSKLTENSLISEWAESDSNQRPPPCQGGILTRLDHRP